MSIIFKRCGFLIRVGEVINRIFLENIILKGDFKIVMIEFFRCEFIKIRKI